MDFWSIALWALAAVAVACAIWGIFIERFLFRIRRSDVAVLPAGSHPITVLHISDFHLAPWQRAKQRFIASLAERIHPDLIVDTGDNLGHREAIPALISNLDALLARPGVFVNGSNDYHAPVVRNPFTYLWRPSKVGSGAALDTASLMAAFAERGWLNLNNRGGSMVVNGTRIAFVGIDDRHDEYGDIGSISKSAAVIESSLPATDLLIGVTHAPYLDVLAAFGSVGADLVLAGHTHGGQVCIPGFGALTTNCDLPTRYAKGISRWGSRKSTSTQPLPMILNVCAGLGNSIFAPVRFACLPEVRVLTLVARD